MTLRSVDLCYKAIGTFYFFPSVLLSIFSLLIHSSSASLSYFILAALVHKCVGKQLCMSSIFPMAILNGFFLNNEMVFA